MAIQTIETLKGHFSAGKFPTQQNYHDLIDTLVSRGSNVDDEEVVVIYAGYSGDIGHSSFLNGTYRTNAGGSVTNPTTPIPMSTFVNKYNEIAEVNSSYKTVTDNTKIVIVFNNQWWYYGNADNESHLYLSADLPENSTVAVDNTEFAAFIRNDRDGSNSWITLVKPETPSKNEVVVIEAGYGGIQAGDFQKDGNSGYYEPINGVNNITNKEQPIPFTAIIEKWNSYVAYYNDDRKPVTDDAKIVVITNDGWFGLAGTYLDPMYVSYHKSIYNNHADEETVVEIPTGSAAAFVKSPYDGDWFLLANEGASSNSGSSTSSNSQLILNLDNSLNQTLQAQDSWDDFNSDGSNPDEQDYHGAWNGEKYNAIWVEELIKAAMDRDGKGTDYDDTSNVILYNNEFWGHGTDNGDPNIYVKYFDNVFDVKYVAIPQGGMIQFARLDLESINSTMNATTGYAQESVAPYESITFGWTPVGIPVTLTAYELSELAQNNTSYGS